MRQRRPAQDRQSQAKASCNGIAPGDGTLGGSSRVLTTGRGNAQSLAWMNKLFTNRYRVSGSGNGALPSASAVRLNLHEAERGHHRRFAHGKKGAPKPD